ncbi:flagellar hook basal-body protein [Acetobacter sp. AN02]|uniref:flagellar hook basal-body protein n=1 Tax=Acetobacter sp. AN02 TaxID=2894186 RepID=UPI002434126A|nr:flagellar hook basal-body protein [Acetobacter sp. AN02]MDG6095720.1 flagellar hook basal-body protein [Acetobacter sp. AN02]
MDNTTYIALSRMDTEMRAMTVLANNLANASTAGFKSSHVLFSDYLSKMKDNNGIKGADTDFYTQDRATYRDQTQGTLETTGNPLDLALVSDGYFSVQTANGVRLTRNGRFQRMSDGRIADADGNVLLDRRGQAMVVPQRDVQITVAADGTVMSESGVLGEIATLTVDNQNTLQAEGGRLFRATTQTRQTPTREIRQGMIESSNVSSMTEITNLIQLQRDFQITASLVENEATRRQNAIDKITQLQS